MRRIEIRSKFAVGVLQLLRGRIKPFPEEILILYLLQDCKHLIVNGARQS